MTRTLPLLLTAGLVIAAVVAFTPITMKAQTIISNERLVSTTLVVNKTEVVVGCASAGCSASSPMVKPFVVVCPAAMHAACTFHILLDAKVTVHLLCGDRDCLGPSGSVNSFQFLVDGAAPEPGPTGDQGDYVFGEYISSDAHFSAGQSYPASIVARVVNGDSQNHTIAVNLRCLDKEDLYGCGLAGHWNSLRVDVFEP